MPMPNRETDGPPPTLDVLGGRRSQLRWIAQCGERTRAVERSRTDVARPAFRHVRDERPVISARQPRGIQCAAVVPPCASNHFRMCKTLLTSWLGRFVIECDENGTRTSAVSTPRSFKAW